MKTETKNPSQVFGLRYVEDSEIKTGDVVGCFTAVASVAPTVPGINQTIMHTCPDSDHDIARPPRNLA